MYEIRSDIKYIQAQAQQVVAIIESLNRPMVAVAGRPSEASKAYIVGIRQSSGLFSIYVYLHLPESQESVVFLHSPEEITMEDYHETELEALGFVESMGFIVDNMNFRNQPPRQQAELMNTLPLFHADLKSFSVGPTSSGDQIESLPDGDGDVVELDVLDLEEVIEERTAPVAMTKIVTGEGLAKIVRLLSSF